MGCGASGERNIQSTVDSNAKSSPDIPALSRTVNEIYTRLDQLEAAHNSGQVRISQLELALRAVDNAKASVDLEKVSEEEEAIDQGNNGIKASLMKRSQSDVEATIKDHIPVEKCICDSTVSSRAQFLSQQWLPFLRELKDELLSAQTKYIAGFGPEELFCPQARVEELTQKCAALTLAWHGARNYSVIYEFLMELHDVDRSTYPYRFEELPAERSADGWVRVIDGNVRKALHAAPKQDGAELDVGGVPQYIGDSAIDNTVLPNLMPAAEAHALLAGGAVKRIFVRRMAGKQGEALGALSAHFARQGGDAAREWSNLAAAAPQAVAAAVQCAEADAAFDAGAHGIQRDALYWAFLRSHGRVIQSFSQLSAQRS